MKRKEELLRKGGVAADLKVIDFPYFTTLYASKEFATRFKEMQSIYVFKNDDKLTVDEALNALEKLHKLMSIVYELQLNLCFIF